MDLGWSHMPLIMHCLFLFINSDRERRREERRGEEDGDRELLGLPAAFHMQLIMGTRDTGEEKPGACLLSKRRLCFFPLFLPLITEFDPCM